MVRAVLKGRQRIIALWATSAMSIAVSVSGLSCATAATLQGAVQHMEKLEPLRTNLRPGKPLNAMSLEPGSYDWFKIPKWLGGTWITLQEVQTYAYDDKSGASDNGSRILIDREQETFGFQTDARGDVWTMRSYAKPILTDDGQNADEANRKTTTSNFRDNEPLVVAGDQLTLRSNECLVKFDRDSKKIQSVERAENIRTLTWLGDDLIAVKSDIKIYDNNGFPLRSIKKAGICRKIKEYVEVDEFGGHSVKAAFSKYLEHSGKVSLGKHE